MEIKNKFNIGDAVWFIESAQVKHEKIIRIDVAIVEGNTKIFYTMENMPIREDRVFENKEDLINSL